MPQTKMMVLYSFSSLFLFFWPLSSIIFYAIVEYMIISMMMVVWSGRQCLVVSGVTALIAREMYTRSLNKKLFCVCSAGRQRQINNPPFYFSLHPFRLVGRIHLFSFNENSIVGNDFIRIQQREAIMSM